MRYLRYDVSIYLFLYVLLETENIDPKNLTDLHALNIPGYEK
jgi:hypothetical protein